MSEISPLRQARSEAWVAAIVSGQFLPGDSQLQPAGLEPGLPPPALERLELGPAFPAHPKLGSEASGGSRSSPFGSHETPLKGLESYHSTYSCFQQDFQLLDHDHSATSSFHCWHTELPSQPRRPC
eukprot:Skav223116  [mRNA]  locus=scaffold419:792026:799262:+ [translate_table: standard]